MKLLIIYMAMLMAFISEPDHTPYTSKALPDSPGADVRKPRLSRFVSGRDGGARSGELGLHGIDVSHHQGEIDWSVVARQAAAGFVYIKATEGQNHIDTRYARNVSEARRYGLKVGSYHFFRPNVPAGAQYKNFMQNISLKDQDLVPLIDVEDDGGLTIAALQSRVLDFARMLTKALDGRVPMIYTGMNFYNKFFAGNSQFVQYPFMIAQYNGVEPQLDHGDDYLIWQYTSKSYVPGIKGRVDQSCFRGGHTLGEIMR